MKRILAYSSIAHAGYILMGAPRDHAAGREAALLYLFVYSFMAIGAFAVVTDRRAAPTTKHPIDDYRGMALRRPLLGGLLIFFVLAQAGIPLTERLHREARDVLGRRPTRATTCSWSSVWSRR